MHDLRRYFADCDVSLGRQPGLLKMMRDIVDEGARHAREPQVRALAEAQHYLDEMAQDLARRGFVCETATPYGKHAATWIVEEARLRGCEIAMTTAR